MARQLLIAAGVIALLTAGALLLVNRLTEPGPGSSRAERAATQENAAEAAARFARPPEPVPYQQGNDLGAPIVVPAGPVQSGPVMNEAAPLQGPAPMALPEDPYARRELLQDVRRQRMQDMMERINRRNLERGRTVSPDLDEAPGGTPLPPADR